MNSDTWSKLKKIGTLVLSLTSSWQTKSRAKSSHRWVSRFFRGHGMVRSKHATVLILMSMNGSLNARKEVEQPPVDAVITGLSLSLRILTRFTLTVSATTIWQSLAVDISKQESPLRWHRSLERDSVASQLNLLSKMRSDRLIWMVTALKVLKLAIPMLMLTISSAYQYKTTIQLQRKALKKGVQSLTWKSLLKVTTPIGIEK